MALVGKKAPNFTAEAVVNGEVKKISLDDFKNCYKVIAFYPMNFTFVCPTELHEFQNQCEEFAKRNVQVIGISVDSIDSHLEWLKTPKKEGGIKGVDYPLISDINKTIARDYGVLDEQEGVALRGLFLLDKDNIVQCAIINNLSLGRNIAEVLRLIDALQHVEQKGEVCPVNWCAGKKAMKPSREGIKEYFKE